MVRLTGVNDPMETIQFIQGDDNILRSVRLDDQRGMMNHTIRLITITEIIITGEQIKIGLKRNKKPDKVPGPMRLLPGR
ncbi:hypothetical protein OPIT5_00685 [Opitutaceae bacterium TAV5]|nr:hypothetical protein OPIT5_00685 [Opitutaceae bacterium TAV5]